MNEPAEHIEGGFKVDYRHPDLSATLRYRTGLDRESGTVDNHQFRRGEALLTAEGCGTEDVFVRVRRFFIRPPQINRILTFVCYLYREVDIFPKLLPEQGGPGTEPGGERNPSRCCRER